MTFPVRNIRNLHSSAALPGDLLRARPCRMIENRWHRCPDQKNCMTQRSWKNFLGLLVIDFHWFRLISYHSDPFRTISIWFSYHVRLNFHLWRNLNTLSMIQVSLHLSGAWHTARLEPCMKCPQRRSHFLNRRSTKVSHQVIRVTPFVAHVAPFFSGIPIIPSYWEFGMRPQCGHCVRKDSGKSPLLDHPSSAAMRPQWVSWKRMQCGGSQNLNDRIRICCCLMGSTYLKNVNDDFLQV